MPPGERKLPPRRDSVEPLRSKTRDSNATRYAVDSALACPLDPLAVLPEIISARGRRVLTKRSILKVMKVFLSHATADAAIARFLKASLVGVGVSTFMLPDDAPPGSAWMEQIREGLTSSEELFTLLTPASLNRPWISAEWAAFWVSNRATTPLLVGTQISDIWEPMRARQAVNLEDPAQSLSFLKRLADHTGIQPTDGVWPLSREVAQQIPEIRERALLHNIDAVMTRISKNLQSGATNLKEDDVFAAVKAERVGDLVVLGTADQAAAVKQKQLAVALVRAGRPGEAFGIAKSMHNRNEVKNIVFAVLDTMNPSLGEESEEWIFLTNIYDHLGTPQLRNVRERMLDLGIYPRGPWFDSGSDGKTEPLPR